MPPPKPKQETHEMKFAIEKVPRTPAPVKPEPPKEMKEEVVKEASPAPTKESSASKVKEEASETDSTVLKEMLRIEVDFPSNKVVNLIDEYQEYLEENGLKDERSVWRELNNLEEDEDQKQEAGDDELMPEQAFNPLELNKKHKKFDYHSVIKGMISRLEMEGTLAEQKSIGRTEKGKRFNCEREREDYYDLDDNFIDDEEALLCNDSMSQLIQPRQPSSVNPEEELSKFYDRFKFLPVDEVKNEMENIQARKR